MRNAEYWRGRFSILEENAHKQSDQYLQSLEDMFMNAQRTVQADIERWYGRFATNNGISLMEARKMLTTGQLEEFKWTAEQYVKAAQRADLSPEWIKKLENASTRFHVSRFEAIQLQIQQQIELLYGNQLDGVDSLLKQIVSDGYTHTAFEVQKGVGLGWDITGLDQKKLETLLSKPWTTDGRTFRDRCWLNKNDLVGSVSKSLTQGLLRGDSPAKITTAIQKQFGVHRYKAGRLVNTETTYFNAVATKECYKDLDVEMVEIIETLDSHTCSICGGLDGKVIPISQYEPGVTVPPFHPNCRGTTAPAIDPKYAGERAARNANGDVYYVPGNMSYSEWKKTFVDNGSKDGLTLATIGSIIKNTVSMVKSEGSNVQTVGRIDIEKYRCITDEIATDEVIITPERIQHIEERHPGDYEQFVKYVADILENPDYILEANKPNTGVILKEIERNGEKFKVILRVKVESDPAEYRNSILSFWQIGETTWKKNVKNKKILYKRE
jgi:SPP1 gp7 family putative phage head morphogenesis protein